MNFLLQNWPLVALAVVSGGLLLRPLLQGEGGDGIAPSEAVRLMNREKAVVIDVCEPDEFAAGHIANARNLPLGSLDTASKGLPTNKQLPLVVVCAAGVRAARGAKLLQAKGYNNVQVLAGGMRAWREANLPVESSKSA